MEYQQDVEMMLVLKTPNLELSKEQHLFLALTFIRQITAELVERVGENPTSSVHASLTDSNNTPDTELEMEPEQPPPTPDMSLLSGQK